MTYKNNQVIVNKENEVMTIESIQKQGEKTLQFTNTDGDIIAVDKSYIELAINKYARLIKEAREEALGSIYVNVFKDNRWSKKVYKLASIMPDKNISNRFVIIEDHMITAKTYVTVADIRVNNQELVDLEKELGI